MIHLANNNCLTSSFPELAVSEGAFAIYKGQVTHLPICYFDWKFISHFPARENYFHKIIGSSSTDVFLPFIAFDIPLLEDNPLKVTLPSSEQAEQLLKLSVTNNPYYAIGSVQRLFKSTEPSH
jgi:hypothetical protein